MFKIIRYIINLLLLVILASLLYLLIVQPSYVVYLLDEISLQISNNNIIRFIFEIIIIVYFIILIASFFERFFKKSKSIYVNGVNGKIEVNLKTIEDISKNFLESKNIIKQAKVNVKYTYKGPVINASIENYKTTDLNNKLSVISTELAENLQTMVGVKPRKINLSVNKINNDEISEENIDSDVKFNETIKNESDNIVNLD